MLFYPPARSKQSRISVILDIPAGHTKLKLYNVMITYQRYQQMIFRIQLRIRNLYLINVNKSDFLPANLP